MLLLTSACWENVIKKTIVGTRFEVGSSYLIQTILDWARFVLIYTSLNGILPRMMQICMIIYTHLAYTRMTENSNAVHVYMSFRTF
jgi:hypothetical protein